MTGLTWETATDWNNAKSANDARVEADLLRVGVDDTEDSPLAHYQPDSTTAALQDRSGNGYDAVDYNHTYTTTAEKWRDVADFNGSDEYADFGSVYSSTGVVEFEAWVYPRSADSTQHQIFNQNQFWVLTYDRNDNQGFNVASYGDNYTFGSGFATNTWHHIYVYWDVGTEYYAEINGSSYSPYSTSDGVDKTGDPMVLGAAADSSGYKGSGNFDGQIAAVRAFEGSSLTLGQNSGNTLYDKPTSGTLTTATKSFSSSTEPNVTYITASGSPTITARGSPSGTPEEHTVTLDGSHTHAITWSNAHTDFDVTVDLSDTDRLDSIGLYPGDRLVWGSEGDWDSAQSESNVAHGAGDLGVDTIREQILAHYPFESSVTQDTTDNTSPSNNGAALTSTASVGDSGAYFDGSSNVNLGSPSVLDASNLGDAFTVCAWIRADSSIIGNSTRNNIIGRIGSNNDSWSLGIGDNGGSNADQLRFYVDDGSTAVFLNGSVPNSDQWYHVAGVYDGAAGEARLYLDGSLDASDTSISGGIASSGNDVVISNGSQSYVAEWVGEQDDIRIFNRALSSSELSELANPPYTGSLTTDVRGPIL